MQTLQKNTTLLLRRCLYQMNKKKINTDDITNELQHSAFFPATQSPTINDKKQELTKNENDEEDTDSSSLQSSSNENKQSNKNDVITSSRHDVAYREWKDIIENTETHNSALRLTNEERFDIEDLVSELRRKYKIKTSMNELARLGLLYIVQDFKKNKTKSLVHNVKKS